MRRSVLFASSLFVAFAATACQEQTTEPTAVFSNAQFSFVDDFELGATQLPDLQISDVNVINPSDYVCSNSSPVTNWWVTSALAFRAAEPAIFDTVYSRSAAVTVATYATLLFETTARPQTFGPNGEYTEAIAKAERDNKRFWDIETNIQVVALRGSILMDTAAVRATYSFAFGLPAASARGFALRLQRNIARSQVLNGGRHPLFSFNAFASTFGGRKIAMGDGMLEGYEAVGLGDVAPEAIFAHEYAHHIQFQRNYFLPGNTPEATRYSELMADAMAAYYLTHARGASLNQKRVELFLEAFYQIGDCSFASPGHHGTPNQRRKAAQLGFQIADEAQKQGHILPAADFHARFVAAYAQIIAPDVN